MSKLSELRQTSRYTHDMHMVVVSLQELSIIEMDRIRSRVLQTREYTQGLLDIFLDVRISQQAQVKKELEKSLPQTKTALLFLSQNQRFSDVNIDHVWHDYTEAIKQYPQAELILVGQVAQELAHRSPAMQGRTTHAFVLPSNHPEITELESLFALLAQFDRIVVYHGEFMNIVEQRSAAQDITGRETLLNAEEFAVRQKRSFLFEPDLVTILAFFEKEIEKSIVMQTVRESRLAHIGSRVQTLESARNSIESKLDKLLLQERRALRQLRTKKQQQRLAGFNLWS